MAGKAGVPEDFIPITDPEELAAMRVRMLRWGALDAARGVERRLRSLARSMRKTADALRAHGAVGEELEALRRQVLAMEATWDPGITKIPKNRVLLSVRRGAEILRAVFPGSPDAPAHLFGPTAISWSHVRASVPRDLARSLRGARGWERVQLLSSLDDDARFVLLVDAVTRRRVEHLEDSFPRLFAADGSWDAMRNAILTRAVAKESKGDDTHKAVTELLRTLGLRAPTKKALQTEISRRKK